MTAIVFQTGVIAFFTLFNNRTFRLLNMEPETSSSLRSIWALAQEIGSDGMEGMLTPSVRLASGYAGVPGVVGSPMIWYE